MFIFCMETYIVYMYHTFKHMDDSFKMCVPKATGAKWRESSFLPGAQLPKKAASHTGRDKVRTSHIGNGFAEEKVEKGLSWCLKQFYTC